MYLGLVLIVLAILFAVIGIFSGGVFTIVLVPLAVIGAVAAGAAIVAARAAGLSGTLTEPPRIPESGTAHEPPAGKEATTPDGFVEARQKSQ